MVEMTSDDPYLCFARDGLRLVPASKAGLSAEVPLHGYIIWICNMDTYLSNMDA